MECAESDGGSTPVVADVKWKIRKMVWDELERRDLVCFLRPCHGRIPNFVGSEAAARHLASCEEFERARNGVLCSMGLAADPFCQCKILVSQNIPRMSSD